MGSFLLFCLFAFQSKIYWGQVQELRQSSMCTHSLLQHQHPGSAEHGRRLASALTSCLCDLGSLLKVLKPASLFGKYG